MCANWQTACAVAITAGMCTACSGRMASSLPPANALTTAYAASSPGKYIKHIVIIVQENRSFENLFAGWPAPMHRRTATCIPENALHWHSMTYANDCVRVQGY